MAFLRTKADRLLDDIMYNSGVDDEQLANQRLHAHVQNAFQQRVVAYPLVLDIGLTPVLGKF